MVSSEVVLIGRDLLLTALLLSLPAVVVSLLVGGVISVFQTVTSIQEQTLTFAPRIVAVALVLMGTLPWSLKVAMAFTSRMMLRMIEATQ
ncbi:MULTISPECIES: flagellar biosynthetic protein FliQ [Thalassoglobus]|uniref:Flagellar biosynthetic protein FliQ n=1 Tax=Thalassoglobus polymorphus TaxID=2527994 RepID=A0A517QMJ4_9PLAN|nr:flagellar biosynthetic protein FliQ [Thalassoglobus polymorphus]QDT32821.1 Flagellar biosynthetic protein FliQ [Thalassoglobus polymorphus]